MLESGINLNYSNMGFFVLYSSTIRDKIIPHAVSWFTGEAVQGDELEIEDDDEEEDEEDEDEDEDIEEDEDEDDEDDEDVVKTKKKVQLRVV